MDQARIRNFCIVAHIDHGKSTLADRILELTHAVDERAMRAQVLDSMELERERGITIKAQAVRVFYTSAVDGEIYQLHLIDTPGHVDFTYEVSRSLQACEGALLVVDAAQGVEAQTVANTYLAIEAGLELIPCLNKLDLPGAEPERVAGEVSELIGEPPESILKISAKTGAGVPEVLEELIARVPPPKGDPNGPARALIFDSEFDQYRGVIAYIRVVDGVFQKGEAIRAMAAGTEADIDDIGVFGPQMMGTEQLAAGEVGYLITGLKDVTQLRVGDTLTTRARAGARSAQREATEPLPGYREVKPMVFCGLFPIDSDDYPDLRDALEKLTLNDAALSWEPETSDALGFGFRCGFLGPAAHGHRARAPGARVRPGAAGDDALGAVRRDLDQRGGDRGAQPAGPARPGHDRADQRAVHQSAGDRPERVRRRGHGALPGAPRRALRHALPLSRARADDLRAAVGGNRARLLRPAEVAHARLRLAGLRARADRSPRTWSSSTYCSRAIRWTRCRWSCTARRRMRWDAP